MLACSAGVAGAVSRTATAPVDRMKLLLQVDSTARGLTVREGWGRMAAEGAPSYTAAFMLLLSVLLCKSDPACWGFQGARLAALVKAAGGRALM